MVETSIKDAQHGIGSLFPESARADIISAFITSDNPDLTVSEIADEADVSRSTVYNHLDALRELEIIVKTREIGGSTLYTLRSDKDLVAALKTMEGSLVERSGEHR